MNESTLWIIGFVCVAFSSIFGAVLADWRFGRPWSTIKVFLCILIGGWGLFGVLMGLYFSDPILCFAGFVPLIGGASLVWLLKPSAKEGGAT